MPARRAYPGYGQETAGAVVGDAGGTAGEKGYSPAVKLHPFLGPVSLMVLPQISWSFPQYGRMHKLSPLRLPDPFI